MLQALGVAAGIVVSVVTLWRVPAKIRRRSTLKTDLEILRLLEPTDPDRNLVKEHVSASIFRLYSPAWERRVWDRSSLVFGAVVFVGFATWATYLLRNGFTWLGVPVVFFALMGLVSIWAGVSPPEFVRKSRQDRGEWVTTWPNRGVTSRRSDPPGPQPPLPVD